jgi:hypothetical protein
MKQLSGDTRLHHLGGDAFESPADDRCGGLDARCGRQTISAGVAWTLSRMTRTRRVEGISFITMVSFVLFLIGIVLCYFGDSNIVDSSV